MRVQMTIFFLLFGLVILPKQYAFAAPPVEELNKTVSFSLPEGPIFSTRLAVDANLPSMVLEDGGKQQTYGKVIAKISAQRTVAPPIFAPTMLPVSGVLLEVTPTPYAIPTSAFNGGQPSTRNPPPIWLTLTMLGFCCLLLLIIGVFVLGFFVRAQNLKTMNNDQVK